MTMFADWASTIADFQKQLNDAVSHAELGVRMGGQPESVTTNTLVYPMLRMLGYDPERMNECVPQGRPQSPSKSGSASFLKAPVDLCLFPASGNRIPLEVKPFTIAAAALRNEVGQIDLYMRYNRSKVGLKTNGKVLLVFAIPDNAERNAAPDLVSEFDFGDLLPEQAPDLFQLHRHCFLEGAWTQRASKSVKSDLPPTIEFGRAEEALIDAIRRQCPTLNQSDIIRTAVVEGVPRIKQLEAGIERFFQRVANGEVLLRTLPYGFRTDHLPHVKPVVDELHRLYPKRGTRKGRFSADTVIGFLVEDWARINGLLPAPTEEPSRPAVLLQKGNPETRTGPQVPTLETKSLPMSTKQFAVGIADTLAVRMGGTAIYRMWHPQAQAEKIAFVIEDEVPLNPVLPAPQQRTLVLTAGVSGAGKSTWIREHLAHLSPAICSADDFCVDLDGNWSWSHETVLAAHSVCKRLFNEMVADGVELIVVDNQNLMAQHRQHYLDWARKHGYQCCLVVLDCDAETAFKRNTHGVTRNGILRQQERLDLSPGVYFIPEKPEILPTSIEEQHEGADQP